MSPTCPECGAVMVERFRYETVNRVTTLAIPLGLYDCLKCVRSESAAPAQASERTPVVDAEIPSSSAPQATSSAHESEALTAVQTLVQLKGYVEHKVECPKYIRESWLTMNGTTCARCNRVLVDHDDQLWCRNTCECGLDALLSGSGT